MSILNRKDETHLLIDGLFAAAIDFAKNRNDQLSDAELRRLFLQRAMKFFFRFPQRTRDPNLAKRYAITLTGSV
jgi:hypothetical protein